MQVEELSRMVIHLLVDNALKMEYYLRERNGD